jgi:hypothetical protein
MKKTSISTRQWWLVGLSFVICHLSFSPAGAQTFTQRLQQKTAGEGRVTVTHSQSIDDLVNGTQAARKDSVKPTTQPIVDTKTAQKPTTAVRDTSYNCDTIDPTTVDSRKKVMRGGHKVWGYRVQVFAGGNQRKDRQKAERTGSEIKALMPDMPVYVHFYSPRWICRIGNFRTYEEAHSVLTSIKKEGYTAATIIKEKITVYQ